MASFFAELKAVLRVIDAAEPTIDPLLLQALVAAEDRRFFFHWGVDPIAIFRSIVHWVVWQKIEGASTIEAQLFRSLTNRRELSLTRKLREAVAAVLISLLRSKKRVAAAYLDVAYLGFEPSGIRFAAERLGIDLKKLGVADACELVCRLKRPSMCMSDDPKNRHLRRRIGWLVPKVAPNDKGRR